MNRITIGTAKLHITTVNTTLTLSLKWNIHEKQIWTPENAVTLVRKRDRNCVYCKKKMSPPSPATWPGDWSTIEHLNYLPPWDNPETIAICCGSCNSSRGNKPLLKWFQSNYCLEHKVSLSTVAKAVRDYIERMRK